MLYTHYSYSDVNHNWHKTGNTPSAAAQFQAYYMDWRGQWVADTEKLGSLTWAQQRADKIWRKANNGQVILGYWEK